MKKFKRGALFGVLVAAAIALAACQGAPPSTGEDSGGEEEQSTAQPLPEGLPEETQPLPDGLPEEGDEHIDPQDPDLPEEGEDMSAQDPTSWAVGIEHDQFPEAGESWNASLSEQMRNWLPEDGRAIQHRGNEKDAFESMRAVSAQMPEQLLSYYQGLLKEKPEIQINEEASQTIASHDFGGFIGYAVDGSYSIDVIVNSATLEEETDWQASSVVDVTIRYRTV